MPTAFDNTNQNAFGKLNFTDWSQVADMFGTDVVQALQKQNIPLDQVGSTMGSLGIARQVSATGQQFGAANPQFVSSGFTLADAINSGAGSGGTQGAQTGFDATQTPNYDTSLIGAKALDAVGLNPSHSVTINASPSQTPSSSDFAKSGVSSVANPEQVSLPSSFSPQTSVPSIFTPAQGKRPTRAQPVQPIPQATAASYQTPQPYASPPPISVPQGTPMPTGTLPPPPAAPAGAIAGSPYAGGPISSLSPNATPPGPPSLPAGPGVTPLKHMATGGQVQSGNTDTVPAMLTPGEYVINRDAAQQIGVGRLNRLNAEGPIHRQAGGEIPGASPSSSYSPGAEAQSWAFQQLSPSEQAAFQGGGAGGQQVTRKFNQLVDSYSGSTGTPTPMSAQLGGMGGGVGGVRTAATAQVHPQAPAAPAGQPQQQQQPGYSGSLDQWLSQYGHTPQGQAYIAQNGNVSEVQRYLQNLTTPQSSPAQAMPAYTDTAPRASLVSAPANYGTAPRAELVGLPAGQGQAYDPKTYGVNTGPTTANVASNIASGIGSAAQSLAQAFTKGSSQPYRPIQSAIPNPEDFKRQTPDIVLQGHQVGKPNVPGGYVLMAQPQDQGGEEGTVYLS